MATDPKTVFTRDALNLQQDPFEPAKSFCYLLHTLKGDMLRKNGGNARLGLYFVCSL